MKNVFTKIIEKIKGFFKKNKKSDQVDEFRLTDLKEEEYIPEEDDELTYVEPAQEIDEEAKVELEELADQYPYIPRKYNTRKRVDTAYLNWYYDDLREMTKSDYEKYMKTAGKKIDIDGSIIKK